ncbi:MAG: DUF11 domain-containing protein [Methanobrevibacter millerae]|uniref:DUF11 domain-containing protein n=2 Tax=Methanobrevibacter millerae TaxID=230361 RepID=A0A8T3V862_9EURY|nr:DUF11 domain-containing protein [Methanobrevibacter millerae]
MKSSIILGYLILLFCLMRIFTSSLISNNFEFKILNVNIKLCFHSLNNIWKSIYLICFKLLYMKKLFILLICIVLFSSSSFVSAEDINATLDTNPVATDSVQSSVAEDTNISKSAYLVLDNDADKEDIHIGDYVTWIVTVQNLGPDMSQNTQVRDELPDGLKYCYHTLTKGSFNPQTGIWNIGDLKVEDGEVALYITCIALTAGEKINKVWLTSDTFNPNNETFEEEEIDVLDHDDDKDVKKEINNIHKTGNPIFLILISLFGFAGLPFMFKKQL